jgi:hypothetical protein
MRSIGLFLSTALAFSTAAYAFGFSETMKQSKAQYYKGKAYAAVDYYELQQDLKNSCEKSVPDSARDRKVATIAAFKGPKTIMEIDRKAHYFFQTPKQREHFSFMGFIMVGTADKIKSLVEISPFYKNCSDSLLNFCIVAIYGTVRYIEPKSVNNWFIRYQMGSKECIIDIDYIKPISIQDRTIDGIKGAVDGAIFGFKSGVQLAK